MQDGRDLRQEIIDTCLWLKDKGYLFGTWGNISVRVENGEMLITPSKIEYEKMRPEDFVVMALDDGRILSGTNRPTSEREIHRRIMKDREDVHAIVHTHSAYAMAAAALNHGIPPISEEMCQLIGGGIPLSKEFVPSDQHVRLGEVAADSIGQANAVLIRNHGPVCCGRTLAEAVVCCQIVEKSAQMYLQLQNAPDLQVIPQKWVDAGRNYYLYSYGKS